MQETDTIGEEEVATDMNEGETTDALRGGMGPTRNPRALDMVLTKLTDRDPRRRYDPKRTSVSGRARTLNLSASMKTPPTRRKAAVELETFRGPTTKTDRSEFQMVWIAY